MSTSRCARCGASGQGKFCARCGAPFGGRQADPHDVPPRSRPALVAAGLGVGLLALVVAWVALDRPAAVASAVPTPAAAEAGAPPDLSTMTPRERFDRLYNRVMRAAEQGDTATVARFSPMAFLAYGQLDSVDADARYHAAVLRLHVQGDTAGALRLADSIQMSNPKHLFAFLIRGTAAGLVGNDRLLREARAGFLGAWDAEMKAGRPEYRDHQVMLEQFRDKARAATPGAGAP